MRYTLRFPLWEDETYVAVAYVGRVPLRCLVYRAASEETHEEVLEDWLARVQERFVLVRHEVLPFPRFDKRERRLILVDEIELFVFVPPQDGLDLPGAHGHPHA